MRPHYLFPPAAPKADLHLCVACLRPFVVPREILEVLPDGRYVVELGCNDCGWTNTGTYDEDTMVELDYELDLQQLVLEEYYAALEAERLEAEIVVFAQALRADLIVPEDF